MLHTFLFNYRHVMHLLHGLHLILFEFTNKNGVLFAPSLSLPCPPCVSSSLLPSRSSPTSTPFLCPFPLQTSSPPAQTHTSLTYTSSKFHSSSFRGGGGVPTGFMQLCGNETVSATGFRTFVKPFYDPVGLPCFSRVR